MNHNTQAIPCFCSWSGGKDSCLALYKAIKAGYSPNFLLTTLIESGTRSRSHGLAKIVLQTQAASLGIPLITCNTSWQNYSNNFRKTLRHAKSKIANIIAGIFGDIDLIEHKTWVEQMCQTINCRAVLPLWQQDRKQLVAEFLNYGFKATIVAVAADKLPPQYLNRSFDYNLLLELEQQGIDPCGENGEFHTIVTDGPIFSHPLKIAKKGAPQKHSDYYYQDLEVIF